VAERPLDQRHGGAAVERVAGVGVAQPVRADGRWQPGAPRGRPHDQAHPIVAQPPAGGVAGAPPLAGAEDGRVGVNRRRRAAHAGRLSSAGSLAPGQQVAADADRQQDHPHLVALAVDGELGGLATRGDVAPAQAAQLGDAQAAVVEDAQQEGVARIGLEGEQALVLGLGQDALGRDAALALEAQGAADIDGQVAEPVAEGEQGLDAAEDAAAAGRVQAGEAVGEGLEIAQRDGGQGLVMEEAPEARGVGPVGAGGVGAAAVQPEGEEVRIVGGLSQPGGHRGKRAIRQHRSSYEHIPSDTKS
jgi:hypothetical protein